MVIRQASLAPRTVPQKPNQATGDSLLFQRQSEHSARNKEAIAALYETHYDRVARDIAVRIGNIDEAEDLASEVFIKAVRSADSYREKGAPMEAWLFKIAHNITVDQLRKRSRRPLHTPIEEAHSLADHQPNPEEQL